MRPDLPIIQIDIADSTSESELPVPLQALLRRLAGAQAVAEIGAMDGEPQLVFGEIKDVAIDGVGNIYVLDSRYNQVRVFAASGEFIEAFGRPGRGPGELAAPLSIAIAPSGDVYVGDITRQIHVFRRKVQRWQYQSSVALPVAPYDMCMLGDRLFVHGTNPNVRHVIHETALSGRVVNSFGEAYNSDNALINFQLSKGRIACDARSDRVFYAPASGIAEVRAYRSSGAAAWVTVLQGYLPITLTEHSDASTVVGLPERGFHRIESLTVMPPAVLLIQVAFVTRESRASTGGFARLHTLALSPATGAGSTVNAPGEAVAAGSGSGYVSLRQDPWPRFTAWHF